jgi:L-fuconolactonase
MSAGGRNGAPVAIENPWRRSADMTSPQDAKIRGPNAALRRDQIAEQTLDPGQRIIDAHHHLWDGSGAFHGGAYWADDLIADAATGHQVIATVYVDAHANYAKDGPVSLRPVAETAFANAEGERLRHSGASVDVCRGIVSNIDLMLDDAVVVLDAHRTAAPERLKGVRQVCVWVEGMEGQFGIGPAVYDDARFRRNFGALAERGLSFDACVSHVQLPQVSRLAADFPQTSIILNHFGLPLGIGPYAGRREAAFQEWFGLIEGVAAHDNVSIKLGGINGFIGGFDWTTRPVPPGSADLAEALAPYFERALRLFGVERCLFESNWPVDRSASSYHVAWNAYKRLAASLAPSARQALFFSNTNRLYRLGLKE